MPYLAKPDRDYHIHERTPQEFRPATQNSSLDANWSFQSTDLECPPNLSSFSSLRSGVAWCFFLVATCFLLLQINPHCSNPLCYRLINHFLSRAPLKIPLPYDDKEVSPNTKEPFLPSKNNVLHKFPFISVCFLLWTFSFLPSNILLTSLFLILKPSLLPAWNSHSQTPVPDWQPFCSGFGRQLCAVELC